MSEGAQRRVARVAALPYLNTAPFFVHWDELVSRSEGHWTSALFPPRQLGQAADAGEVDAGLLALADLTRLADRFEPLVVPASPRDETFGIANRGRVDSVLLFVRESLLPRRDRAVSERDGLDLDAREARALDGAVIGVTGETSTSFRLLRLLLEVRYGIRPRAYPRMSLETGSPNIAAALVIGDLALRWRHSPPEGFVQAIDLAAAWQGWMGLPFVFARWGVRRDLDPESKLWLGRFLAESLRDGLTRLDELTRDLPADLGSPDVLHRYLANFTYELGPEEERAAAEYQRLLRQHDLLSETGAASLSASSSAPNAGTAPAA